MDWLHEAIGRANIGRNSQDLIRNRQASHIQRRLMVTMGHADSNVYAPLRGTFRLTSELSLPFTDAAQRPSNSRDRRPRWHKLRENCVGVSNEHRSETIPVSRVVSRRRRTFTHRISAILGQAVTSLAYPFGFRN